MRTIVNLNDNLLAFTARLAVFLLISISCYAFSNPSLISDEFLDEIDRSNPSGNCHDTSEALFEYLTGNKINLSEKGHLSIKDKKSKEKISNIFKNNKSNTVFYINLGTHRLGEREQDFFSNKSWNHSFIITVDSLGMYSIHQSFYRFYSLKDWLNDTYECFESDDNYKARYLSHCNYDQEWEKIGINSMTKARELFGKNKKMSYEELNEYIVSKLLKSISPRKLNQFIQEISGFRCSLPGYDVAFSLIDIQHQPLIR